ncbi:MAG: hypothetical protein WCO77_13475, partial [bacterium]
PGTSRALVSTKDEIDVLATPPRVLKGADGTVKLSTVSTAPFHTWGKGYGIALTPWKAHRVLAIPSRSPNNRVS